MKRLTTPYLYYIGDLHYVNLLDYQECVYPDSFTAPKIDVNVWVAISATATRAIKKALDTENYTGPVSATEIRIFRAMLDRDVVQGKLKTQALNGKKWYLFSLNFVASTKAKQALDYLAANRAGNFVILGAWKWNGQQVTKTNGPIMYPLHPKLVGFMPANKLVDIQLLQGQQPRRFT